MLTHTDRMCKRTIFNKRSKKYTGNLSMSAWCNRLKIDCDSTKFLVIQNRFSASLNT